MLGFGFCLTRIYDKRTSSSPCPSTLEEAQERGASSSVDGRVWMDMETQFLFLMA